MIPNNTETIPKTAADCDTKFNMVFPPEQGIVCQKTRHSRISRGMTDYYSRKYNSVNHTPCLLRYGILAISY